jgi:hypothetical protein
MKRGYEQFFLRKESPEVIQPEDGNAVFAETDLQHST